jgi:hypothetical protein
MRFGLNLGSPTPAEELLAFAQGAIPRFEQHGDLRGLFTALSAISFVELYRCQFASMAAVAERALDCARQIRDRRLETETLGGLAAAWFYGPLTVEEALGKFAETAALDDVVPGRRGFRGELLAMLGRFDEARADVAEARAMAKERGAATGAAITEQCIWTVETLAGNHGAAAEAMRLACGQLEAMGERGWLSTMAGLLACSLATLHLDEEAEHWASVAGEMGASDDIATQMVRRQAVARIRARTGATDEAELLAREAVALAQGTDMLNEHGHTLLDLAEVLEASGSFAEATQRVDEARALYERKGNLVMAGRARERLAGLGAAAT